MEWDDDKQARLDALRASKLAGTLDEAGKAELAALVEFLDAEERDQLAPAMARMQAELAVLHQQLQESEAENEQLAGLMVQMEQLLADWRHAIYDLQRRHDAIRTKYQQITGKPLSAAMQRFPSGAARR